MSPRVKRQKEKFKIPPKYWLLALTLVSVLLMFLTFLTDIRLNPANALVGYTIVPFQKGITSVSITISSMSEVSVSSKTVSIRWRSTREVNAW